ARAKTPKPDRNAVNEAARAALAEIVPGAALSKRFFALRAPLPVEARGVSFIEKLGAQAVDLDLARPLEAARGIASALGGEVAVRSIILEENGAKIESSARSRVAVLADRPIRISGTDAVSPMDAEKRVFILDSHDGALEVSGEKGTTVATLVASGPKLSLAVRAFRTASHAAFVEVVPSAPAPSLVVNVRAGTAEATLARKGERFLGSVAAEEQASTVTVNAVLDGNALPPIETRIGGAAVHVEPKGSAVVGAPLALVGELDPDLPDELVPGRFTLTLRSGSGGEATGELVRKGAGFQGDITFAKAGSYSLSRAEAGELGVGLASPIEVAPAPALAIRRKGEPGPLALSGGTAEVEVELELTPPPTKAASVSFSLTGIQGEAISETHGLPGKATFLVKISAPSADRAGNCELVAKAKLAHGEAVASLPLEITVQPWKKIAAAALLGLAVLWLLVVLVRRRSLAKLWGEKQLRGIGTNGKMSYERYLLRDHRVSRRAAVAPPGATAARVEIQGDGRALARAEEGSHLLRIEAKPEAKPALPLVHETAFAVVRGLYNRRYVYLEREPTASELEKRYVPEARSYEGSDARTADSDVIVLLEEKQNLVPPSQRIVPVDSARLPKIEPLSDIDSDESVVIADSYEAKVIDSQHLVLDPGSSSSAGPVPIIDAGSSDASKRRSKPPILDPGSSDEGTGARSGPMVIDPGSSSDEGSVRNDHLMLGSRSSDEAPALDALESGVVDRPASGDTDMGPVENLSEDETNTGNERR
ncbi:hypothetical protein HY251_09115, partial [bacterium]|nr:hypothetical protein [bacterium]